MRRYCRQIPTMRRFSNNWVGCITSKARTRPVKIMVSSSWRSLLAWTALMRKVGISSGDATWRKKSIPRHMRHINRRCTAMAVIRHSGAPSAFFTTASTNTAMPWTPTPVLFASIRTFPRFGTTWELSTSLATTRRTMLLMLIKERRSWIRPTKALRTGWPCFAAVSPRECSIKARLPRRRMCTRTLTSQV